jgi:phosphate transport system substrate-binding protein
MRKITLLTLFTMFALQACGQNRGSDAQERITLSGAWALYPMVVKWAEEYQKIHPDVRIDVAAGGAGKGMADALAEVVDLGMVSREIYPAEIEQGAWWVSVTKDAVVATVNDNNPVLDRLLDQGLHVDKLRAIWITGSIQTWGDVFGEEGRGERVHVYTRSDACGAADTWADFLGKDQEDLIGIGTYGDPGVADAVKRDVLGIGYNNINFVYDSNTKKQVKGIRVVPLDLDGNGRVDAQEAFYSDRDRLTDAVANGIYPSPPSRNLHLVSQGVPKKKAVRDFLEWILTEGQKYVPESGYVALSKSKCDEEMAKLAGE